MMKVLIVTVFACITLWCIDMDLYMMNAKDSVENAIGLILLVAIMVISVSSRFGLKPYNYLVSKIKK